MGLNLTFVIWEKNMSIKTKTATALSASRRFLSKNENAQVIISIIRTLTIFGVFIVLFTTWFGFEIVKGNGMFPSFADGDLTLVYQSGTHSKNDVVYYDLDGVRYLGRIIAKEGDVVDISPEGILKVNGTAQTERIVYPTYPTEDWTDHLQVPEGCLFILGDFRTQTIDSRTLGCVPESCIYARVIAMVRHRML